MKLSKRKEVQNKKVILFWPLIVESLVTLHLTEDKIAKTIDMTEVTVVGMVERVKKPFVQSGKYFPYYTLTVCNYDGCIEVLVWESWERKEILKESEVLLIHGWLSKGLLKEDKKWTGIIAIDLIRVEDWLQKLPQDDTFIKFHLERGANKLP